MKLDLLDSYNIRVRLSANIILFAPIAITVLQCFPDTTTLASSTVFVAILLAFTNYTTLLQRRINQNKIYYINYAARYLEASDNTLDSVTKLRYYSIMAKTNPSFSPFNQPNDSEQFKECCASAVVFLKTKTRENNLVKEENINYGFCKSLYGCKKIGIFICLSLSLFILIYWKIQFGSFSETPSTIFFAFFFNIGMLLFWCFGITNEMVDEAAQRYAKRLLSMIDTLKP